MTTGPEDTPKDAFNDPALGAELDGLLIFGTPETRRVFLKRLSGTGVALIVGPKLLAIELLAAADAAPVEAATAKAADTVSFGLTVNGQNIPVQVDPRTTLLDLLRNQLGLTGSKKGCDHGQCGACTVLVDGKRINSCLTLAVTHEGAQVRTIEGLASGDRLHPVQAAFLEHDGFQCGYCTPGQICSAVALIQEGHAGNADEIREWMSGNICRCGAYPNILASIQAAKITTSAT
jgi:xanthine dehydrogenase YagT iron-sulfur-binding subunit